MKWIKESPIQNGVRKPPRALEHVPHIHHLYHLWKLILHTPAGRILFYRSQQEEARFSPCKQPSLWKNCCNSANEKLSHPTKACSSPVTFIQNSPISSFPLQKNAFPFCVPDLLMVNQSLSQIVIPLLCACVCVCVCVKSLQLCLTLWNAMDCSLPGSSVHGIL